MLGLADDDFANADGSGRAYGFAQQRVRFLAAFRRHEVVGRLEVARIDFVLLHEVQNVDRFGLFERSGLEVLVGEDDEFTFLVLVAFDDLVPGNCFPIGTADALVLDGREIFLVQQSEADMICAHRGLQLHRDVDEAECQRALPDCGHSCTSSRFRVRLIPCG